LPPVPAAEVAEVDATVGLDGRHDGEELSVELGEGRNAKGRVQGRTSREDRPCPGGPVQGNRNRPVRPGTAGSNKSRSRARWQACPPRLRRVTWLSRNHGNVDAKVLIFQIVTRSLSCWNKHIDLPAGGNDGCLPHVSILVVLEGSPRRSLSQWTAQ